MPRLPFDPCLWQAGSQGKPFDAAAGSASGQDGAGGLVGCRSCGGVYGIDAIVAIFFKVSFRISLLAQGSTRETKKQPYRGMDSCKNGWSFVQARDSFSTPSAR